MAIVGNVALAARTKAVGFIRSRVQPMPMPRYPKTNAIPHAGSAFRLQKSCLPNSIPRG
jgi:hypothetical protein